MHKFRLLSTKDLRTQAMTLLMVMALISAVFLIVFENILEKDSLFIRMFGYFISMLPFFLFAVHVLKGYPIDRSTVLIVVTLSYQSLTAIFAIITNSEIDKTAMVAQFVSSLSLQVILFTGRYQVFGKKAIKAMFVLNFVIALLFIALYFSDKSYKYENSTSLWLTLNMGNSNYTAIMLLGNFDILLLTVLYVKNKIVKVGVTAVSVFVFYMVYKTTSRMVFALAILVLFCFLFKIKIRNWQIVLCITIPIIFYLVYNLFNSVDALKNMTILGKPLFSGRIELWSKMFDKFYKGLDSVFFGNFSVIQLANAHNGFLTVLFNYGIIGYALYSWSLYDNVYRLHEKNNGRKANVAMYTILSYIFISLTEGSIVVTGRNFCVFYIVAVAVLSYEQTLANGRGGILLNDKKYGGMIR